MQKITSIAQVKQAFNNAHVVPTKLERLTQLNMELDTLSSDLDAIIPSKPQFLIDDDDEYQDQLEALEAKHELVDDIATITKEIEAIRATIDPETLEAYDKAHASYQDWLEDQACNDPDC